VKLIPPQYVKPFVKRRKNDRNDAEAISEAASRPSMRTVSVKSVDEQAAIIIVRQREMLVGQRTQAINALREHAAEFGVIAAKGSSNVEILLSALSDHPAIPGMAKAMFEQMGRHVADLDEKIQAIGNCWSSTRRTRLANALRQFLASDRSPRSPWHFR
jgi:transposase